MNCYSKIIDALLEAGFRFSCIADNLGGSAGQRNHIQSLSEGLIQGKLRRLLPNQDHMQRDGNLVALCGEYVEVGLGKRWIGFVVLGLLSWGAGKGDEQTCMFKRYDVSTLLSS